jgi:hypothetical protein
MTIGLPIWQTRVASLQRGEAGRKRSSMTWPKPLMTLDSPAYKKEVRPPVHACLTITRSLPGLKAASGQISRCLLDHMRTVIATKELAARLRLVFDSSRVPFFVLFALDYDFHGINMLALAATDFVVGARATESFHIPVDAVFSARRRLRWNEPRIVAVLLDPAFSCDHQTALLSCFTHS